MIDALTNVLPALALVVGALLLVRRFSQRGRGPNPAALRVLARTGLTRSAVVAVVEVGDRRFLVGAADHGVSVLTELENDEPTITDLETTASKGRPGVLSTPESLAAMDRRAITDARPRMGLADRLRTMTVRTHSERPISGSRP